MGKFRSQLSTLKSFVSKESEAKFTFELSVMNRTGYRKGSVRLRCRIAMDAVFGPEAESITVSCRLAPHSLVTLGGEWSSLLISLALACQPMLDVGLLLPSAPFRASKSIQPSS